LLKTDIRKFTLYNISIFAVFTLAIGIAGYFSIGMLSDDYLNTFGSINSSLIDKFTGNLPFASNFHLRTTAYLSLQSSAKLHDLLGFSYDDFVIYRIQNLILYFILAYTAGRIILMLTGHLSVSVLTSLCIIVFPNNINNICWTVARVDLLCCIFFLFALYFALYHAKNVSQTAYLCSILSFIAGLFTKEAAISVPFILIIFLYGFMGSDTLKKQKPLIITMLAIVALYVLYKVVVLQNSFVEMMSMYQTSPILNSPGVIVRAAIALTIPFDFLTLSLSLRDKDPLLMIYLASLYGGMFYLITIMIRNDVYKYVSFMLLSLFILIVPNIIIGYIRTQMILIPFVIITIMTFWVYDHQIKFNIHVNKTVFKVSFVLAFIFWTYWSMGNVSDWNYAFQKSKENVNKLINKGLEKDKETVIIGSPGRFNQAFLFDKLTGAYNYWRYKGFVVNDTLNDIVQTGATDKASLGSKLNCTTLKPGEFEISATGKSQYFYIEGFDTEKMKTGFTNSQISVVFKDFNILNKPTKLILKILSPRVNCYLASGFDFEKIY